MDLIFETFELASGLTMTLVVMSVVLVIVGVVILSVLNASEQIWAAISTLVVFILGAVSLCASSYDADWTKAEASKQANVVAVQEWAENTYGVKLGEKEATNLSPRDGSEIGLARTADVLIDGVIVSVTLAEYNDEYVLLTGNTELPKKNR